MPHKQTNKGPYGGTYRNEWNHLESGGPSRADEAEAESLTGATIAYEPIEDRRDIGGEERGATEAEQNSVR